MPACLGLELLPNELPGVLLMVLRVCILLLLESGLPSTGFTVQVSRLGQGSSPSDSLGSPRLSRWTGGMQAHVAVPTNYMQSRLLPFHARPAASLDHRQGLKQSEKKLPDLKKTTRVTSMNSRCTLCIPLIIES
jgi:hypothetical protein